MTTLAAKPMHRTSAPSSPRHLLGIGQTDFDRLKRILMLSRDVSPSNRLAGRTVATAFFEDSTRTRLSFTQAAELLGARVLDLAAASSSLNKGESLTDTVRTLSAIGAHAVVMRTRHSGAPAAVATCVPGVCVINAGDGRHEHPTQALGDALTLAEALDRPSFDFAGLRIAIVGDLNASRVARSNIALLSALGAEVVCTGPSALVSPWLEALGCVCVPTIDDALRGVHGVMMLRIQFERYGSARPIASPREYRAHFGLTVARARAIGPSAVVLHPGPTNRGVEIDPVVADGLEDGPRSLIAQQVANGVRARMAVLSDCLCRD